MDARSIFHFLDAGHKVLPGDPKTIDMMTNAGSDWKTSTETCPVPNGATKLVVMPSLFKVAAILSPGLEAPGLPPARGAS